MSVRKQRNSASPAVIKVYSDIMRTCTKSDLFRTYLKIISTELSNELCRQFPDIADFSICSRYIRRLLRYPYRVLCDIKTASLHNPTELRKLCISLMQTEDSDSRSYASLSQRNVKPKTAANTMHWICRAICCKKENSQNFKDDSDIPFNETTEQEIEYLTKICMLHLYSHYQSRHRTDADDDTLKMILYATEPTEKLQFQNKLEMLFIDALRKIPIEIQSLTQTHKEIEKSFESIVAHEFGDDVSMVQGTGWETTFKDIITAEDFTPPELEFNTSEDEPDYEDVESNFQGKVMLDVLNNTIQYIQNPDDDDTMFEDTNQFKHSWKCLVQKLANLLIDIRIREYETLINSMPDYAATHTDEAMTTLIMRKHKKWESAREDAIGKIRSDPLMYTRAEELITKFITSFASDFTNEQNATLLMFDLAETYPNSMWGARNDRVKNIKKYLLLPGNDLPRKAYQSASQIRGFMNFGHKLYADTGTNPSLWFAQCCEVAWELQLMRINKESMEPIFKDSERETYDDYITISGDISENRMLRLGNRISKIGQILNKLWPCYHREHIILEKDTRALLGTQYENNDSIQGDSDADDGDEPSDREGNLDADADSQDDIHMQIWKAITKVFNSKALFSFALNAMWKLHPLNAERLIDELSAKQIQDFLNSKGNVSFAGFLSGIPMMPELNLKHFSTFKPSFLMYDILYDDNENDEIRDNYFKLVICIIQVWLRQCASLTERKEYHEQFQKLYKKVTQNAIQKILDELPPLLEWIDIDITLSPSPIHNMLSWFNSKASDYLYKKFAIEPIELPDLIQQSPQAGQVCFFASILYRALKSSYFKTHIQVDLKASTDEIIQPYCDGSCGIRVKKKDKQHIETSFNDLYTSAMAIAFFDLFINILGENRSIPGASKEICNLISSTLDQELRERQPSGAEPEQWTLVHLTELNPTQFKFIYDGILRWWQISTQPSETLSSTMQLCITNIKKEEEKHKEEMQQFTDKLWACCNPAASDQQKIDLLPIIHSAITDSIFQKGVEVFYDAFDTIMEDEDARFQKMLDI